MIQTETFGGVWRASGDRLGGDLGARGTQPFLWPLLASSSGINSNSSGFNRPLLPTKFWLGDITDTGILTFSRAPYRRSVFGSCLSVANTALVKISGVQYLGGDISTPQASYPGPIYEAN